MKVVTCCGCCSLKTGTIIIGATDIVLPLIYLILYFKTNVQQEAIMTDHPDMKTIRTIYAVCYCGTIGISTMLIIGALKKNAGLMLLWLCLDVAQTVGYFVNLLISSIMSYINNQVLFGVLWLILGLIEHVIEVYIWLVVYNFRKELLLEKINIRMGPCGIPHNCQQVAGQN